MYTRHLTLLLALSLTACAAGKALEYPLDAATATSPQDIAILHVPGWIYVDSIDGRGKFHPGVLGGLRDYPGARIELQKGSHTAQVRYYQKYAFVSEKPSTLSFEVEGNRSYFLLADLRSRNNQMYVQFAVHPCDGATAREINRSLEESAEQSAYVKYRPVCPDET